MHIFARYAEYFIAIPSSPSRLLLCKHACTHIHLWPRMSTHFRAIVFLPLRTFAGEIRPGDPVPLFHLASSSILFLFLQSPHPLPSLPPLFSFFTSSLTAILPFCHHLSAFVPFSFLSFSNLTPKPSFSSVIPENNQLCTTYLLLLSLLCTR